MDSIVAMDKSASSASIASRGSTSANEKEKEKERRAPSFTDSHSQKSTDPPPLNPNNPSPVSPLSPPSYLQQQPPTSSSTYPSRSKLHTIESKEDWERYMVNLNTLTTSVGTGNGNSIGTVLAYFSNNWCPPCRMIEPKFLACADFYPSITFIKVDTDDFPDIAQACEVEYTPTFQFFRNGVKIDEYVGSDAEQLRGQIGLAASTGGQGQGQQQQEEGNGEGGGGEKKEQQGAGTVGEER